MELPSLAQLEAPFVWGQLLPASSGGGRNNPLVVPRLPGQRIYHVVFAGRGGNPTLGRKGIHGQGFLVDDQGHGISSRGHPCRCWRCSGCSCGNRGKAWGSCWG